jgi:hypothetical protein
LKIYNYNYNYNYNYELGTAPITRVGTAPPELFVRSRILHCRNGTPYLGVGTAPLQGYATPASENGDYVPSVTVK